ncbi:hypothetical protein NKH18_16010 [Streptomyces sp. M10(2022)]
MAAADHRARRRRVAVVTASFWPDGEKPPLPQTLCHGALSRQTAELIDDGKGARSARRSGRKGKSTDHAVFKGARCCAPTRTATTPRVYTLIIEDNRNDPHYKPKNSVPLGPGVTGWALPDKAEANLPAGCAARMGSTAPNITVALIAPSKRGRRGEGPRRPGRPRDPQQCGRGAGGRHQARQEVRLRRLTVA